LDQDQSKNINDLYYQALHDARSHGKILNLSKKISKKISKKSLSAQNYQSVDKCFSNFDKEIDEEFPPRKKRHLSDCQAFGIKEAEKIWICPLECRNFGSII